MKLLEEDLWEVLDPNNALPPMEVSDAWFDWAKGECDSIFHIDAGNYDESALSIVLLRTLRVAIDYYEYLRVVYLQKEALGGIHESDFQIIADTLFNAAGIGHFLNPAFMNLERHQYFRRIHITNQPLYDACGPLVPVYALKIPIQGRQYLRQHLGALDEPPEIEPDEFEVYNPYNATDEQDNDESQNIDNDVKDENRSTCDAPEGSLLLDMFDKNKMVTISELVDIAGDFKPPRGDKWVRSVLRSRNILKCYSRKKANESDGYPRDLATGAIMNAAKNS